MTSGKSGVDMSTPVHPVATPLIIGNLMRCQLIIFLFKKVAQLSQTDRAAGLVSFGYCRHYRSIFNHCDVIGPKAIEFGEIEIRQNKGYYTVQGHSRSLMSGTNRKPVYDWDFLLVINSLLAQNLAKTELTDTPFKNANFQLILARSASAVTPREKVQLTRIGSPLRAFQWAYSEQCTLP